MPAAAENSSLEDFNNVLCSLEEQKKRGLLLEEDAAILKKVLENEQIQNIVKTNEALLESGERALQQDAISICKDIMLELDSVTSLDDDRVTQLFTIMEGPYFRSLIEAHDNALHRTYETPPNSPGSERKRQEELGPPIRVVGLTKTSTEPLGITLSKHDDHCIYIQRVLHDSMVERQGLLNLGDVIKEVNGKPVSGRAPEDVQKELNDCKGSISMKVIPSYKEIGVCQIYLKTFFDYSPKKDPLFPEGEQGLAFSKGDILEVVNQSDIDWWQARHLNGTSKIGVIPSLRFEQVRRATVTPSHFEAKLLGQSKKKVMYEISKSSIFDKIHTPFYEEVTKMPPFERKCLVLIGSHHVGRRTIKNRLISTYPDRFACPLPDTSRPIRQGERNDVGYHFLDNACMMKDIEEGKYLEWGLHNGHHYGTRLEEVRNINRSGKICIIDCNPSALKILKTGEFMPYIVFIKPAPLEMLKKFLQVESSSKTFSADELKNIISESEDIRDRYEHFFDMQIINDDKENTYNVIRNELERLGQEHQWVPVSWVF